jgi:hypothetical protein
MRNFISLGFALLLAVVAGLLASDRPALGTDGIVPQLAPPPSATAACFFQGFTCTPSGCSCTPGSELYATVESISAKETESGKEQLDCTGDIAASAPHPSQAVICQGPANGVCTLSGVARVGVAIGDASLADGAVSGHPFVHTTNWMEVIAPSGQVTLHCRDLQPFGI